MQNVISKDGSAIAYDQSGKGPAVILVGGALGGRSDAAALASLLTAHFSVFAYDRRGRGDSGDTAPYAVEREVDDIEALIHLAGGSAFLYGHSSGAVLALEAASKLPVMVKKLAMYEPPFIVDDTHLPVPKDYVAHVSALVSSGRRGDAVELFMSEAVGVPKEHIARMRHAPMWAEMERMAHTLAYDGLIMGETMYGSPLPLKRWRSVTVPTLVMDGGASQAWAHNGAQAITDVLPNAQRRTLEGQTHGADPAVLAPVLIEFFRGSL
jgi:pimeloyl-ACP methyl ester carboxylesterase